MAQVPVYFDGSITLFDVMRAADAIGCTLKRDRQNNALYVARKSTAPRTAKAGDVIDLFSIPSFLRKQAE